jgi:hypothetical protein
MKAYVVLAYRFSDYEKHSYVVGVFSSEVKARIAADDEEFFRGGKYGCVIVSKEIDSTEDDKYSAITTPFFDAENKKRSSDMIKNYTNKYDGDPDEW